MINKEISINLKLILKAFSTDQCDLSWNNFLPKLCASMHHAGMQACKLTHAKTVKKYLFHLTIKLEKSEKK